MTASFLVASTWTYFYLSNPVYVGSYPGGGESSYFFGLVSDRAPVVRTIWIHTDSGWVAATGYAPPLPAAEALPRGLPERFFLYVGRLTREKGALKLAELFARWLMFWNWWSPR